MHTHCPSYAHPLIHAHYFFILIDTFVQFHLCLFLFHPHAFLHLHLLLMHTFGLMLTQCSLRTCLPLVVVIFFYMLPSHIFYFMRSYYSIHPLCLYLHLLFIHAFALLILSTCLRLLVLSIFCSLLILFCFPVHFISPYYLISYLVHLGAPIIHLPIFPHVIFSCPFYFAIFSCFFFHKISILFTISMFNFASLLPYTSPPPSFTSLIVTISSFVYASFKIISDFFPLPHFLSPSFCIFGATYVWPFSVILWLIFLDFCTLQYLTILHLIYDAKYVYSLHFFSFLGMCW